MMIGENGGRSQESLRERPVTKQMQGFSFPLKGAIKEVYFQDHPQNKFKLTLVDVQLFGGYSDLLKVPISSGKTNANAGEEWTPEKGDLVIIQFINGMWTDPIITGYYPVPENEIMATAAEVPPNKRRYHKRCNKTDIVIDKDGSRTTTIEKDESIYVKGDQGLIVDGMRTTTITGADTEHIEADQASTIDGKRTTIIEGNDETTINSGDLKITVAAGKCTVTIAGKTAWSSAGIDLDGGNGSVKGVVTQGCLCSFTGAPHAMVSTTVKASL